MYVMYIHCKQEEDRTELSKFLQDLLCMLSLCHAPLDSLKAAISELTSDSSYHELLLTVLWEGVVHTSAQVRIATANMFEVHEKMYLGVI